MIYFININYGTPFIQFSAIGLTSNENGLLTHKPWEVWQLDFWSVYCHDCPEVMNHNQSILERHPEWKIKVRIIGIAIGNNNDSVTQMVYQMNWHLIEHYIISNINDLILYGIKEIPCLA